MRDQLPSRRSIRLKGYNYAQQGAYFVTFCTHQRRCILSRIENGVVTLTPLGIIVFEEWVATPEHRPEVDLDLFVIMPNHVHAIVLIQEPTAPLSNASRTLQSKSLGAILGKVKSQVTRRAQSAVLTDAAPIWQRNYYEHIIRDEPSLESIRFYIENNPAKWETDQENPERST